MSSDLVWGFDLAVIEWLIVLTILVVLAVGGALLTRRTLRAFRGKVDRTDDQSITSASWHTESAEVVLESLETITSGYQKKRQVTDLLNMGRISFPSRMYVVHCCAFSTSSTMY